MLQGDYHFSPSVSLFQTPDRIRGFAQPIALVDDGCHFPSDHEFTRGSQIHFVSFCDERYQLLAHEALQ
jgi:hypothetical protein